VCFTLVEVVDVLDGNPDARTILDVFDIQLHSVRNACRHTVRSISKTWVHMVSHAHPNTQFKMKTEVPNAAGYKVQE
jgi:hypothetical protein